MMQIPETRFVKIAGGQVTVEVASAAEASHAIKELRLVKRAAQRHRRELATAAKKLEKASAARSAKPAKPARPRPSKPAADEPVIDNPLSYVWHSLAAVAAAASGSSEEGDRSRPQPKIRKASASSMTREIARVDEIIAGVDSCLEQIEARLLATKAPRAKPPRKGG